MSQMTGAGLKAWREAAGWSQSKAAEVLEVTRETISRVEKAAGKPISAGLAEAIAKLGGAEAQGGGGLAPKAQPKASPPDRPKAAPKAKGEPPLHLRTFGRTAAECRAIREAKADKDGRTTGVPLVPLRPDWVTMGNRRINAAIPRPLDREPPAWAGPRGVVSGDGHCYDFETAHRMTTFA